jgi:hypothetical protein
MLLTDIQKTGTPLPSYEQPNREGKHIGHTSFSSVKTCPAALCVYTVSMVAPAGVG